MKLTPKLSPTTGKTTKKQNDKENQQLQKALESTIFELKKSKNKKDRRCAEFLANNYIHSETGLITSKFK